MGGIFAPDGTVSSWLTKFTNLVILNVLWILCCLPIITAGAATTALYSVMLKIVRNSEGYIIRDYFRAFKENFKQATVIWGGMLMFLIMITAEGIYYARCSGYEKWILCIPVFINIFIVLTVLYVFPVLAFFNDPVKQIIRNSSFMAVENLPYTLLILGITVLPGIFLWFFSEFIKIASFILVVIGFSFCVWMKSKCFVRIFGKYVSNIETNK